ncbi:MAG TPA: site-specific integrase [Candidatus Sulfotelmatobacter sp.]|nr:site-specific integrase [Candidatus Sulfotelmatobacter sp.]
MARLAIYLRTKEDGKGWRYKAVNERPGIKTSHLNGPFYIRITTNEVGAGGRKKQPWVELDASTFEQAKAERDQKANGQQIAAETVGRIPLANAIANFLELKKRKTPATVANYTHILNEFAEQTDAKFVDQVDRKVLDSYVSWLEEKRAAPKTIHNKLMVIVFLLKEAGVSKPSKIVKDLLPTLEEEIAEPYTAKDLEAIFSKMTDEECVRFTFFLITACREKEVAHAQWKDLVMKGNVPHFVVQAKKFKYSDGSAGEFKPKNHERREIPLTRELVDMLTARKKTSKSEWIFPNENGDPEGHFLRKFKKICFIAGLNCGKCETSRSEGRYTKKQVNKNCATYSEGCSLHFLHRLRKTRATFWHTSGISLRTIQAYLGHADLSTTQKYLGIEDSAEVVSKINRPMF